MRQDVQKTRELEERFSELQKNLDEKRCQYVVVVDIFGASFLWYQKLQKADMFWCAFGRHEKLKIRIQKELQPQISEMAVHV